MTLKTLQNYVLRPLLLLTFTALAAVGGYLIISNVSESEQWVAHTYQSIETLEELIAELKDAEGKQRNYLLTGDVAYLAPYDRAVAEIQETITLCKQELRDNPSQTQRIDQIE